MGPGTLRRKSGVERLAAFQSLDLTTSRQVAMYDDGIGSSAFKPLARLGGAGGWGLKRNVLDLYKFLCRNYDSSARIYAFGFSRGAFTIRVLLGLVEHEGLARYQSEADLHRRAIGAYRAYRKARFSSVGVSRSSSAPSAIRAWRSSAAATTARTT